MIKRNLFTKDDFSPIYIALGFFDCLHAGHRRLAETVKRQAKAAGVKSALLTFDNNFFQTLGKNGKLIYTYDERLIILEELGLEQVVYCTFDKQFMNMSGEEFLKALFALNIRGIVCGFDYTYGCDRCDHDKLRRACADKGIDFTVIDAVETDGVKISSTLIKSILTSGDIETANILLCRPYLISGSVTSGRGEGTKLGFPTANIQVPDEKLELSGVYAGIAEVLGKKYGAIVNCGAKPTFNIGQVGIEAHLLDFSGNIYGKDIRINLISRLRKIEKFPSKDALSQRLRQDVEACRLALAAMQISSFKRFPT